MKTDFLLAALNLSTTVQETMRQTNTRFVDNAVKTSFAHLPGFSDRNNVKENTTCQVAFVIKPMSLLNLHIFSVRWGSNQSKDYWLHE